ncbi:MAG: M20/M25/M40 family metallo-hydrolase [PVC group bacterium]
MITSKAIVDQRIFGKVLSTIQELISIHSLSGREEQAVKYLMRVASRLGFNRIGTDRMGNLIVEGIIGSGEGPVIVLTGHTDTINADPASWAPETRPWTGAIRDGRLFGRGAADMKSALVCMLSAAGAVLREPGGYSGRIVVVGTVVEELFEGVCFLEALKLIHPDYIIVGEASGGAISIGQRGRAEIAITSFGEAQHASTGRKVINAIEQSAYIIDAFHRWYRSDVDQVLGKRNIVPTDIKIPVGGGGGLDGRGGNSTVPKQVEITYDIRTLVEDTRESVLGLVRSNIESVVMNGRNHYPKFRDPAIEFASEEARTWTGVAIKQDKFAPAWKTEPESDLVQKALRGVENALGKRPELGHYSFCTDGSAVIPYRQLFPGKNPSIIGYGPGNEDQAHTVNESVAIDDLKEILLGYQGICRELLK